jgi:hypothetical protein
MMATNAMKMNNIYLFSQITLCCQGESYITNFPSQDLIMEIVGKLFFHEFMFFEHKCCASKTHMIHI